MRLADAYDIRLSQPSDIQAHVPTLADLASRCRHVTEFGVRKGVSTVSLLHGLETRSDGGHLVSYDIEPPRFLAPAMPAHVTWDFRERDTAKLEDIDPTDFLFIDTLHTCAQVVAELRHSVRVRRFIALHDTILFGSNGERGQPGITHAIYSFLAEHGQTWRVKSHSTESCGLLVLERVR